MEVWEVWGDGEMGSGATRGEFNSPSDAAREQGRQCGLGEAAPSCGGFHGAYKVRKQVPHTEPKP